VKMEAGKHEQEGMQLRNTVVRLEEEIKRVRREAEKYEQ